MKVLSITRGTLELARVHIEQPMSIIGRSPSCDVVLRASGVAPVHFMLEWIGEGSFNSGAGKWSILDVSSSGSDSGEGTLLEGNNVTFRDFNFTWIDDSLEAAHDIGGKIHDSIAAPMPDDSPEGAGQSLEIITIRAISEAIEEIQHYPIKGKRVTFRPYEDAPKWTASFSEGHGGHSKVTFTSKELNSWKFSRNGSSEDLGSVADGIQLEAKEIVQATRGDYSIVIRLVSQYRAVKRAKNPDEEPAVLLRFALLGLAFSSLMLLLLWLVPPPAAPDPEEREIRVAKVELNEPIPVPPVPPTPPEDVPVVKKDEVVTDPEPVSQERPKATADSQASAPRFKNTDQKKNKAGLNIPKPPKDVNTVGLLGALRKTNPADVPKIRADQIMNNGIVTESVSGPNASIVLKNSASGVVDNRAKPTNNDSLVAASTTLKASQAKASDSVGTIARPGGKADFAAGSNLEKGSPDGRSEIGQLDGKQLRVSGGLDRETVRRVIVGSRGQMRACYERALLTNSSIKGRISFMWDIAPSGSVVKSQVSKSDISDPVLANCVNDAILAMKFPEAANGRPTKVIYPFVFQAN